MPGKLCPSPWFCPEPSWLQFDSAWWFHSAICAWFTSHATCALLQAASSANVHFHFLHIKSETDSATATAAGSSEAGADPAAAPEAQLAVFASDFSQLENVTAQIMDSGGLIQQLMMLVHQGS
jgi:hypothetical protein